MKNFLKTLFAGFTMGVANVIPGVSGGTLALITGVFDPIVDAMRLLTSKETWTLLFTFRLKQLFATLPWMFLAALGAGVALAFATTARLMVWLLNTHQTPTYAFFLGLIVASLAPVARRAGRWNTSRILSLIAGIVIGFYVVNLVPTETPDAWWMLMLAGAVSFCAMILPGISGSFILLVLGKYETLWGAVANLASGKLVASEIAALAWIALGGALGLALFAHVFMFLLKRFNGVTLAALTGLMAGSLWKLWPWQMVVRETLRADGKRLVLETRNIWPWQGAAPATAREYALVAAAFVVGALCVWLVERFAGSKK